MTVTLDVYSPDRSSLIGTLDQPFGISWSRERFDTGAGQFTIPHDSPIVQANPGILDRDNIVVVNNDGLAEFAWLMRRRNRNRADVWDPISVTGPGVLELLRLALVYQRDGLDSLIPTDDRLFGWMTTDFDDSNWGTVAPQQIGGPLSTEGWPDGSTVGYQAYFPGERDLYRRRMIAVPGAGGPARMLLAATWDTEVVIWLDGKEVLRKEKGERGVFSTDIEYREYDQQLAVEVNGDSIGRWGWAWIRLNEPLSEGGDTTYGSVIRRTYDPAEFPDADSDWLRYSGDGLPYPGVSPGFILRTLMEEATARGFLSAVTFDFDDVLDSAGNEWPDNDTGIEFACQVGDDNVLSVIERLRDLGVDAEMTPDLVLRAWQGRGVDRGGTPDSGESTVAIPLTLAREVGTETEDEWINVVLVRTAEAWQERPSVEVAEERREGFLSLGMTPTIDGGARIADSVLDDFNTPRQVIRFTVSSSQAGVPTPTVDYDLGDIIEGPHLDPDTIAAPWSLDDIRVDTIAAQVDLVGEVDWIHEASTP